MTPSRAIQESVHRIALLVQLKSINIPKDLEASHLFHMQASINADHMFAEPHKIHQVSNESERLGYVCCLRNHGQYPECT